MSTFSVMSIFENPFIQQISTEQKAGSSLQVYPILRRPDPLIQMYKIDKFGRSRRLFALPKDSLYYKNIRYKVSFRLEQERNKSVN